MTVYSPSATLTFMRCPMLWYRQSVQHLRLRRLANPELAAAVGIGFSKGMEVFSRGVGVEAAIDEGIAAANAHVAVFLDARVVVHPHNQATLGAVSTRVEKALRGFDKKRPLPTDWHTFLAEVPYPEYGWARPDMLCQTDMGPCILDFKTKVTAAREEYVEEFLSDMETSWQMLHYVYFARKMGAAVTSYAVCLVVIEPLRFHVRQWAVEEDVLTQWYENALYWWGQMDRVKIQGSFREDLVPMVGDHRDRYGLCPMYDACFHLTPESRHTVYFEVLRTVP